MIDKKTDASSIEINQLVGYLPQPTPEPQRYVVRVIQLPGHESAPRHAAGRAKGLIVAVSGPDQSLVGKTTWLFLEDIECLLSEGWDAWVGSDIPLSAYARWPSENE